MQAMDIQFEKYQGTGNDFIILDSIRFPQLETLDLRTLAPVLCDRHTGIGADGILVVSNPADTIKMTVINADGSIPEMCGNGLRCVAQYVWDQQYVTQSHASIQTDAGILTPMKAAGLIKVDMGAPQILGDGELHVNNRSYRMHHISMGNPHAVIMTQSLQLIPFTTDGPALSQHAYFSDGANIEFVEFTSRESATVLVWERGAGPTQACGTGACAAVVAGIVTNHCDRTVSVSLPGGELIIHWDESTNHVFMTGPAKKVFHGTWPISF